jgi:hypothetical protein
LPTLDAKATLQFPFLQFVIGSTSLSDIAKDHGLFGIEPMALLLEVHVIVSILDSRF